MSDVNQVFTYTDMKVVLMMVLVAAATARPDTAYDKYANFDVDEVISSVRLLKGYANCFTGEGKCSPDAKDFKNWIPEAIHSSCGKCSEKQKLLVAKVIKAVREKLPTEYDKLYKIHDSENKRAADLDAFLEKYAV